MALLSGLVRSWISRPSGRRHSGQSRARALTAVRSQSRLSRATIIAYGLPGFAAALPVIPVAVLLPTWYARDLGLGFALTGVVIALARILDLMSDPVVGVLIDRCQWRGLRYKTWIAVGGVLAICGLMMLAFPANAAGPLWLGSGLVILFTGWTASGVPYPRRGW